MLFRRDSASTRNRLVEYLGILSDVLLLSIKQQHTSQGNLRPWDFCNFCLPDCWLVVSMHPERPATGHLDTGFLGFPLSSSKCSVGSQIPSSYCMLLMQPSRF
jgi:hypothetical protein